MDNSTLERKLGLKGRRPMEDVRLVKKTKNDSGSINLRRYCNNSRGRKAAQRNRWTLDERHPTAMKARVMMKSNRSVDQSWNVAVRNPNRPRKL